MKAFENQKIQELQIVFSCTLRAMGLSEMMERALLKEFCLCFNQSSWFPAFLREKKQPSKIYQMANLEWNLAQKKMAANPSISVTAHNGVRGCSFKLNPLARFCVLEEGVLELGFTAGIYVFCDSEMLKLNAQQAQLIDDLEEGTIFTAEMGKNLEELLEHGVILEMR